MIRVLKNELLDIFESEYFQSTVFEILDAAFESCVKQSLLDQIYKDDDSEPEALAYSEIRPTQKVKLVQIITYLFRMVYKPPRASLNSSEALPQPSQQAPQSCLFLDRMIE